MKMSILYGNLAVIFFYAGLICWGFAMGNAIADVLAAVFYGPYLTVLAFTIVGFLVCMILSLCCAELHREAIQREE